MVALGLITLPGLRQAVQRLRSTPKTEEQARREVMQEPISTPTDVQVQAQMFWLSAASPNSLEATAIQLPLSADPVERSKQLLNALIARAPAPEKRTLPAEASLLAFYIQPDGTAIADFSDEISSGMPSGILSEQLAVQSIAQTLGRERGRDPATENPGSRAGSGDAGGASGSLWALSCCARPAASSCGSSCPCKYSSISPHSCSGKNKVIPAILADAGGSRHRLQPVWISCAVSSLTCHHDRKPPQAKACAT